MVRPNVGSTFPRHVFIRAANLHANLYDRVGDRENCFETTLIHLTERFNGKEVYLIGTMNQSTMLAQRTKKLIEELKPDTVLVQTNESWWSKAKLLQFVDSQEELNKYQEYLRKEGLHQWLEYYWQSRKFIHLARWYIYAATFKLHFRFANDFRFWIPGLEVKYACEAAEKVGASLGFLGPELNPVTSKRLYHETRMNVPHYIFKRMQYTQSPYSTELESNR
jgi:pheromone shutdown protein TraB